MVIGLRGWSRSIVLIGLLLAVSSNALGRDLDLDDAVTLSRAYLASEDSAEQKEIAGQLAGYRGEIDVVLNQLRARKYNRVVAGYHPEKNFSIPELADKHPDDLLYFNVPPNYSPKQPTGLIVFLHGGNNTSSRRAPRVFLNYPDEGTAESDSNQLGNLFNATGMVAVGPSAPWDEESYYRWCLRESDEYLADVIRESQARFNIDPDRVFLLGHSMGGFGAYHHAQRQPDRFAAVIAHSGSWALGYLPAMRGTPLCIVQGINDAREGVRWHYTDIEYARLTVKLLTAYKLEHTYFEHDGMHAMSEGKEFIAKYFAAAKNVRRDPFYPHITIATPVGFRRNYCSSLAHNRWLTINDTVEGTLQFDELVTNGEDNFSRWRLAHQTTERRGAMVDAVNRGGNQIVVTTANVSHFTVWLHQRMVDVTKPVTIVVNNRVAFANRVQPTLAVALESYQRRGDWGLIYPIKVELTNKK